MYSSKFFDLQRKALRFFSFIMVLLIVCTAAVSVGASRGAGDIAYAMTPDDIGDEEDGAYYHTIRNRSTGLNIKADDNGVTINSLGTSYAVDGGYYYSALSFYNGFNMTGAWVVNDGHVRESSSGSSYTIRTTFSLSGDLEQARRNGAKIELRYMMELRGNEVWTGVVWNKKGWREGYNLSFGGNKMSKENNQGGGLKGSYKDNTKQLTTEFNQSISEIELSWTSIVGGTKENDEERLLSLYPAIGIKITRAEDEVKQRDKIIEDTYAETSLLGLKSERTDYTLTSRNTAVISVNDKRITPRKLGIAAINYRSNANPFYNGLDKDISITVAASLTLKHKSAEDATMGSISATKKSGSGNYDTTASAWRGLIDTSSITLQATPKDGYYFTGWWLGEGATQPMSTDATYDYVVGGALGQRRIFASFAKIGDYTKSLEFVYDGQVRASVSSLGIADSSLGFYAQTNGLGEGYTDGTAKVGNYTYSVDIFNKANKLVGSIQNCTLNILPINDFSVEINYFASIGYNGITGWGSNNITLDIKAAANVGSIEKFVFTTDNWATTQEITNLTSDSGYIRAVLNITTAPGQSAISKYQVAPYHSRNGYDASSSNVVGTLAEPKTFIAKLDTTDISSSYTASTNASGWTKEDVKLTIDIENIGASGFLAEYLADSSIWADLEALKERFGFVSITFNGSEILPSFNTDEYDRTYTQSEMAEIAKRYMGKIELVFSKDIGHLNYGYILRIMSGANKPSAPSITYQLKIDSIAPEITDIHYTGIDEAFSGYNGWYNKATEGKNVSAHFLIGDNLDGLEGSGVFSITVTPAKTEMLVVGGNVVTGGSSNLKFEGTLECSLIIPDSLEYTISVTDYVGNTTIQKISIKIDTKSPTINSISGINDDVWVNQSVNVAINAAFGLSGAMMQYATLENSTWVWHNTNGTSTFLPEDFEENNIAAGKIFNFSISAECNQKYKFRILTQAGLEIESPEYTIKIDKTAPTIEITKALEDIDNWSKESKTTKFVLRDEDIGSGLDVSSIAINNGATLSLNSNEYSLTLVNSHSYILTFRDIAGNEVTKEFLAKIDTERLAATAVATIGQTNSAYNFSDWINGNDPNNAYLSLAFAFNFGASGLKAILYKDNEIYIYILGSETEFAFGTTASDIAQSLNKAIEIREDQNGQYRLELSNSAGNNLSMQMPELVSGLDAGNSSIKIDTVKPVFKNVSYTKEGTATQWKDLSQWSDKDLKMNFLIEDATSRIQQVVFDNVSITTYSVVLTEYRKYVLTATDTAGNTAYFTEKTNFDASEDCIYPRIDKVDDFQLNFVSDIATDIWTSNDVNFTFNILNKAGSEIVLSNIISGLRVQFSYKDNGTSGGWSAWGERITELEQIINLNGESASPNMTINLDQCFDYKFRLISGSGITYTLQSEQGGDLVHRVNRETITPTLVYTVSTTNGNYENNWTNSDVIFNFSSSKLSSGIRIYYVKVENQASNVPIDISKWTSLTSEVSTNYQQTLTFSKNEQTGYYYFQVVSGSGKSDYGKLQGSDSSAAYSVKIDKDAPSMKLDTNGYQSGTWTHEDVRITLSNFQSGASGFSVKYSTKDSNGAIINYPITISGNNFTLVISDTSNLFYTFVISSYAGTEIVLETVVNVKIDKVAPLFYMTLTDKPVASGASTGWYTKELNPIFTVSKDCISGFVVEYQTSIDGANFGEWVTTDLVISGNNTSILLRENKEQPLYYKFRVISNAGVVSSTTNQSGTDTYGMAILGRIMIDTTKYSLTINQTVNNTNGQYAIIQRRSYDAGGSEILTAITDKKVYSRGDSIAVRIDTSNILTTDYLGYYIKKFTFSDKNSVLKTTSLSIDYSLGVGKYGTKTYVDDNSTIEISGEDISLSVEFYKEITVEYSNKLQYLKSEEEGNKTIVPITIQVLEANFGTIYGDCLSFVTNYNNGSQESESVPQAIGLYTLNIAPGNENFIVTNLTNQTLTVVYFEKTNAEGMDMDYVLSKAEDFDYLDIYMSEDDKYNYLDEDRKTAIYVLSNDIVLDNTRMLKNVFTGTLDGLNCQIALSGNRKSLFNKITGKITNLRIQLNDVTTSGDVFGAIAASAENAIFSNIAVTGKVGGSSQKIGGLVGESSSSVFANIFSNIAILAKDSQYVGGVIGNDTTSNLSDIYSIGEIGISANNSVFVGSVMGYSKNGTFASNYYLKNNITIISGNGVEALTQATGNIESSRVSGTTSETIGYFSLNSSPLLMTTLLDEVGKTVGELTRQEVEALGLEFSNIEICDTIKIDSSEKLILMEQLPNYNFVITADIDMADKEYTTQFLSFAFGGKLSVATNENGDYYTIKNLKLIADDSNIYGFIGYLNGTVSNLRLLDILFDLNNRETEDLVLVGAVAGIVFGSGVINNAVVTGTIIVSNTEELQLGGIVGAVENAKIINSIAVINISIATSKNVIVGGIIGVVNGNNSIITSLASLAKITVEYEKAGYIGNVIGYINAKIAASGIYNVESNTFVNGSTLDNVFGQNISDVAFTDLLTSSYGDIIEKEVGGLKLADIVGKIYPFDGGNGTSVSPFLISTAEQLSYISNYLYADFQLNADIDLAGKNFQTIGKGAIFKGTLSGSDPLNASLYHTISNLDVPLVDYNQGTIKNLKVIMSVGSADQHKEITDTNDYIFGSFARINGKLGKIQTVTAEGVINLYTKNNIKMTVGGIVGKDLGGTIQSCIFGAALRVSGIFVEAGGIVGLINGATNLENSGNKYDYDLAVKDIYVSGSNVKAGLTVGVLLTKDVNVSEINTNAKIFINGDTVGSSTNFVGYTI